MIHCLGWSEPRKQIFLRPFVQINCDYTTSATKDYAQLIAVFRKAAFWSGSLMLETFLYSFQLNHFEDQQNIKYVCVVLFSIIHFYEFFLPSSLAHFLLFSNYSNSVICFLIRTVRRSHGKTYLKTQRPSGYIIFRAPELFLKCIWFCVT